MSAPGRPIDFTLPDHAGGSFGLARTLRDSTVVVLFYRGDW
jgi:peroxiredoxin